MTAPFYWMGELLQLISNADVLCISTICMCGSFSILDSSAIAENKHMCEYIISCDRSEMNRKYSAPTFSHSEKVQKYQTFLVTHSH